MGKITLEQENVDDGVLDDFIKALENATGCTIKWRTVYELEVDDPKAAAILSTVFSSNGNAKQTEASKSKAIKATVKGGKAGRVVSNKWSVLTGLHAGEVLITQKVNKMARSGELHAGTELRHPKLGVRFVSNGRLIEEPSVSPAAVA